ncbi:heme ABC transporter ATP-binding protein [Pedobacter metabolipauper]|uniref:Iron complex transport system ATP-binding protein n=1 Tax=Pedobacter metabolipauper TaxID=425513 RepID=A0A4R6SUL9_9SPHI|nr:heme ABC transporter ATP-binding protein [Pedobacter metabolipauper]TDQ08748.1 iron complex transport system ATP-binding protein [Pedobacter metabolipauper]
MIKVRNLTFKAGKRNLVDNLSFDVKKGELLAVLGANGAGKTTLMKLLCRDIKPDQGEVFINDKAITAYSLTDLAKTRAVLQQHNTLSVSFLVEELVMMGRYVHFDQQPGLHDHEVLKQVMIETGITHLAGRDYNTLSGGEQQRVQLARVIAQIYDNPNACLFLDEPTNGLDLQYQQQIMVLARSMADRGYTVICILHDINFASRFADQIIMLKNGKKVADGTPLSVINTGNIELTFNIKVKLMASEDYDCPLVFPAAAASPHMQGM